MLCPLGSTSGTRYSVSQLAGQTVHSMTVFFRTVMENGIKGTREKDVSHYCIRMISANDNGQLGKYFVDSFIVEFGLMGSK